MIKDQHMGKILKEAIRKSGKTIKQIAGELGISRNTLYSKFRLPYVRKDFVLRLGTILQHDFSSSIPSFKNYSKEFKSFWGDINDKEELKFAKKYFILLEKYNQLLMFLIRISSSENKDTIRDEITAFVRDNDFMKNK